MSGDVKENPVEEDMKKKEESGQIKEENQVSQPDEVEDFSDQIESLKTEINSLKQENASLKDRWLRAAAECDNLKKQALKNEEQARLYGITNLVKSFLPVLDSLEQAIQQIQNSSIQGDLTAYLDGATMTYKMAINVLTDVGVKRIQSLGSVFNPQYHQAVAQIEDTSHTEPVIVEEYLPGYMIHDRVLRAAVVKVSIPPSKDREDSPAQ